MFQQFTKIGDPLCPTKEVSYLINGIKASNGEMNMRGITVKIYRIGMAIYFEASVIHLSYCLPEVWNYHRILSVFVELEEKVKNQ